MLQILHQAILSTKEIDLIETLQRSKNTEENKSREESKKSLILEGKWETLINFTIFFRVQKYERDLKRWEFMEDEQTRNSRRIEKMTEKY